MPATNCTRNCWIAGAVAGLLIWILTSGTGDMRWYEGLFLGLMGFGLLGSFLIWAACSGRGAELDIHADRNHARASAAGLPAGPRPGASTTGDRNESVATRSATASSASSSSASSASAPSSASTAAAATSRAAAAPAQPTPVALDKSASPKSTLTSAVANPQSTPEPAPASKPAASAKPKVKPAAEAAPADPKPKKAAKQPAAAKKDDLKLIKGVGPKLEDLLHENGVTTFAQIAAWDDAEIDRFAEKIGNMGHRIRGEDWVLQAKDLAAGGKGDVA